MAPKNVICVKAQEKVCGMEAVAFVMELKNARLVMERDIITPVDFNCSCDSQEQLFLITFKITIQW